MEFFHQNNEVKKNIAKELFNSLLEETSFFRNSISKLPNFDFKDLTLKSSSEMFNTTSIEDLEIKVTIDTTVKDHHCLYMTKISHVKDLDIIILETKNFDSYRILYNSLIGVNLMTDVDFPRTFKRSKLGPIFKIFHFYSNIYIFFIV
jgi:hypothetical protein